ncbi:hypothetical protein, conserved [Eimeria necatrix]|uniref:Uncharacterized protein n=1 Tax=Eimeria necatrix TaxID=51315 RepID=U6MXG8_9EIME|nr:hypothetical protein, conserved [Eimeria necatrix]CDJ68952.1 hypothetical protein, conserved [Eimeria necatrix]
MPTIGLYCTAAIGASRLCRLHGSFLRQGRGLLSGCRVTERRQGRAFNQRCAEARAGSDASSTWGSAGAGALLQGRQVQRAFSTAPRLDDNTVKTTRGEDCERLRVARLLRRYQMLRPEDRMRLEQEHRREGGSFMGKWQELRAKGIDNQLQSWEAEKREREEQQERTLRLRDIYKPAHLRRRKRKVKRVQQSEEQAPPVVAANFTEEAQTLSLVEDAHKAEVYEEICARLSRDRPTLVNEFTDFDNPYMLKRQALKRLLEERGTRNALDESMIDKYLDKRPDLLKLRLAAKLPPEVVEPLVAFHGITCYNFDKRTRLGQKVNAVLKAVNSADCELDQVLQNLEENRHSDMIHEFHPFRNHFGFVSAVPTGTAGSILMGREESGTDKELRMIRYPTLQRVAHTLPKDAKYRAIVAHAIRVLERSRGWDFKDKLKKTWNDEADKV